jgi:hypothetical protein
VRRRRAPLRRIKPLNRVTPLRRSTGLVRRVPLRRVPVSPASGAQQQRFSARPAWSAGAVRSTRRTWCRARLAVATTPTASCRCVASTTGATTSASWPCCPISSRASAQSFSTGSGTSGCSACCGGPQDVGGRRSADGQTKANARLSQLAREEGPVRPVRSHRLPPPTPAHARTSGQALFFCARARSRAHSRLAEPVCAPHVSLHTGPIVSSVRDRRPSCIRQGPSRSRALRKRESGSKRETIAA